MYIKIHKSYRQVIAVCDSEILGKKFEEGNRQLELRENFYKDKEVSEKEAINIMKRGSYEDATFNIVGKESIGAAIKSEIIAKGDVDYIDNIPFALVLL